MTSKYIYKSFTHPYEMSSRFHWEGYARREGLASVKDAMRHWTENVCDIANIVEDDMSLTRVHKSGQVEFYNSDEWEWQKCC